MTKKLTQSEPQHLAAMELDLDSFLNSDSDSDSTSLLPRRTVDDILNDSDSSTSSPTAAASHFQTLTDPNPPQSDAVSVSSFSTEPRPNLQEEKPLRPGLNLYSRARSDDFPDYSFGRVSRPSPWLLGGVRTNAKPGAALAAAAAASRSMPTPHAAAIKSRWSAAGSGSFQKAVEAAELSERSEAGGGSNSDEVDSETTALSSVSVELERKDEVSERERENEAEEEASGGNAGVEVASNVSVDENSMNLDSRKTPTGL